MGLDQYAFARKEKDGIVESNQLMTWRKHANLEGWMANLYHSRGGKGDFNCIDLKLSLTDIENLEKDFKNLEPASGFFWGQSRPGHNADTEDFIALAYKAIEDGYEIVYTSWW